MNTIFISGESINLCIPIEDDFEQWASWFNSKEITRFLEQGKYPNTIALQKEFYENASATGRLLLMIKTKAEKLLGVISLSEIDYEKSRCQIALVCPEKTKSAPVASLEAMSLMTDHAFQRLGLERVWAGQAYPGLLAWTNQLEVIGYKAEGFQRNGFQHGMFESDGVFISIVKQDYLKLISRRGNALWPGTEVARKMISIMKNSQSLSEDLYTIINQCYVKHDEELQSTEKQARLRVQK
jgi:RimJ/RimL family protein N-acetyltransferase